MHDRLIRLDQQTDYLDDVCVELAGKVEKLIDHVECARRDIAPDAAVIRRWLDDDGIAAHLHRIESDGRVLRDIVMELKRGR